MATIGYSRVSTTNKQQNGLDAQHDALTAAGCERIFTDKMSGARDDRPGLHDLMQWVRPGDVIVVTALDRLGRSLSSMLRTIESLQQQGIVLRSLRENLDLSTPTGIMMASVLGALASYERELIRERASAAREAAIARGQRPGRQPKLTEHQLDAMRKLRADGQSVEQIGQVFPQLSRSSIYRLTSESLSQPVIHR